MLKIGRQRRCVVGEEHQQRRKAKESSRRQR
jgi:hypothetical protein